MFEGDAFRHQNLTENTVLPLLLVEKNSLLLNLLAGSVHLCNKRFFLSKHLKLESFDILLFSLSMSSWLISSLESSL